MASAPTTRPVETLEEKFNRLAVKWRAETGFLSSSTKMADHPAYQEIIAMGEPVVPLILRDLEMSPDHWFKALRAITGANPEVKPEDRGNIAKLAAIWTKWGKEKGYRW